MISKTPQFDTEIAEYFVSITLDEKDGQWRTCRFSGERFYVRPEDIEFYRKIRVPLPTLSPLERSRRRMAFAPGYQFYRVESAASGDMIISVYPPATPFKIYEHQRWFSDAWDPMVYGRTYDPGQSFFGQLRSVQLAVPRPNLITDSTNINSDYTNNSRNLKDCYLVFDSVFGENVYYSEFCPGSKDSLDSWFLVQSDSCYKSWGENLYRCVYAQHCFQCVESAFLYDCVGCEYCFMSANLRNKKYYFYNQPLTKEEYERKMRTINLGDNTIFQKYLDEYAQLKQNAIRKNTFNLRAVDSVGDWIIDSRDCFETLFASQCERVAYSLGAYGYRDSYDVTFGMGGESCYEFLAASVAEKNYGIKFSAIIHDSRDLEYCDLCYNCHDCFGCVGLRNKSFCIFNKQYTEDEYWRTVDEIKTAMLARGEYGEFFPPELSSFPYNASLATAYPGYGDLEEAKRYGYTIEDIQEGESGGSMETIRSSDLPTDIKDVDDVILTKAILDETHGKKFRITPYELQFYRKFNLPLPRCAPVVRMNQWRRDFDLRLRFFERPCTKCGKAMQTIYAPDRPEKNIFCEACYNNEVI